MVADNHFKKASPLKTLFAAAGALVLGATSASTQELPTPQPIQPYHSVMTILICQKPEQVTRFAELVMVKHQIPQAALTNLNTEAQDQSKVSLQADNKTTHDQMDNEMPACVILPVAFIVGNDTKTAIVPGGGAIKILSALVVGYPVGPGYYQPMKPLVRYMPFIATEEVASATPSRAMTFPGLSAKREARLG